MQPHRPGQNKFRFQLARISLYSFDIYPSILPAGHLADIAQLHGRKLQAGRNLNLGRPARATAGRGLRGAQDVDVLWVGNLSGDYGHDIAHVVTEQRPYDKRDGNDVWHISLSLCFALGKNLIGRGRRTHYGALALDSEHTCYPCVPQRAVVSSITMMGQFLVKRVS